MSHISKTLNSLIKSASAISQGAQINKRNLKILYSSLSNKMNKEEANVLKHSISSLESIHEMALADKELVKQTERHRKIQEKIAHKDAEALLIQPKKEQLN